MEAEFKGIQAVVRKLKFLAKKYPEKVTVLVGYTARYALGVHENVAMKGKGLPRSREVRFGGTDAQGNRWVKSGYRPGSGKGFYWDPQGKAQAKFLETPAREKQKEIVTIVKVVTEATNSLAQGLLAAGLFLQRESQEMVPVDTGNLKASAFTKIESTTEKVMSAA